MAQNAHARGDRAVIGAGLALAGDDQNQPQTRRLGVQDEPDQFGMRLGHRHAMKVDPRFGVQLAARHLGVLARIHLQGSLRQGLSRSGRYEGSGP